MTFEIPSTDGNPHIEVEVNDISPFGERLYFVDKLKPDMREARCFQYSTKEWLDDEYLSHIYKKIDYTQVGSERVFHASREGVALLQKKGVDWFTAELPYLAKQGQELGDGSEIEAYRVDIDGNDYVVKLRKDTRKFDEDCSRLMRSYPLGTNFLYKFGASETINNAISSMGDFDSFSIVPGPQDILAGSDFIIQTYCPHPTLDDLKETDEIMAWNESFEKDVEWLKELFYAHAIHPKRKELSIEAMVGRAGWPDQATDFHLGNWFFQGFVDGKAQLALSDQAPMRHGVDGLTHMIKSITDDGYEKRFPEFEKDERFMRLLDTVF